MRINDQPSILTVCVPGVAAEPGALDLNQILAARELAAVAARCAGAGLDSTEPGAKCDACDDSACGLDVSGESSSGLSHRRCGEDGSDLGCAVCIGEAAGDIAESGSPGPNVCRPSFFHADSGKKALELLRMLRFDLLVTGDQLPDMPVGHLIRRVRAAWPWQKWAMVGARITTQDEIVARTLGAVAVFDAPPDWEALSSLAEVAAGKAAAASGSVPADLEHTESMQIAGSHGRVVAPRGERASRGPSVSVAASRRVAGGALSGRGGNSRRAAILPHRLSDRSVG